MQLCERHGRGGGAARPCLWSAAAGRRWLVDAARWKAVQDGSAAVRPRVHACERSGRAGVPARRDLRWVRTRKGWDGGLRERRRRRTRMPWNAAPHLCGRPSKCAKGAGEMARWCDGIPAWAKTGRGHRWQTAKRARGGRAPRRVHDCVGQSCVGKNTVSPVVCPRCWAKAYIPMRTGGAKWRLAAREYEASARKRRRTSRTPRDDPSRYGPLPALATRRGAAGRPPRRGCAHRKRRFASAHATALSARNR